MWYMFLTIWHIFYEILKRFWTMKYFPYPIFCIRYYNGNISDLVCPFRDGSDILRFSNTTILWQPFIITSFKTIYKIMISSHLPVVDGHKQKSWSNIVKMSTILSFSNKYFVSISTSLCTTSLHNVSTRFFCIAKYMWTTAS